VTKKNPEVTYKHRFTLSVFVCAFTFSLHFSHSPVQLVKPLGSKYDLEVFSRLLVFEQNI